jgi:16S rRNA processing protein RimM
MSSRESGSDSGLTAARADKAEKDEATFGAFVRKPATRRVAVDVSAENQRPDSKPGAGQKHIEAVSSLPDDAVEVGAIVDAYGLKGWVKVVPHANAGHGGDAMLAAKRWWLVKGREIKSARCVASKIHSDTIVAQFAGCDDRDVAYGLRGHTIHVSRSDFPKLAGDDEFYWVDLIGLDVVNEAGVSMGRVSGMIDNGAHSVLRVEYATTDKAGAATTDERLIPFVGVYVKTVDLAARKIIVDWDTDY